MALVYAGVTVALVYAGATVWQARWIAVAEPTNRPAPIVPVGESMVTCRGLSPVPGCSDCDVAGDAGVLRTRSPFLSHERCPGADVRTLGQAGKALCRHCC